MSKPKPPAPPDPKETSAASTSTNVGTAVANAWLGNVNENTPDGSTSVKQTGSQTWHDPYTGKTFEVPTFTRNTTLSPQQAAIKKQQDAAGLNLATLAKNQSGRLDSLLGKPFNLSGLPQANAPTLTGEIGDAGEITRTYGTDFSADRQRVEDALMARLNPHLERDREGLRTQLSNQGIKLGSEAYDRGMSDFSRQSNDARLGAILSAGEEQSRLVGMEAQRAGFENAAQQQAFGQNLSRATFGNQAAQQDYGNQRDARNAALQEQFAVRNQPINEITALMSGGQVSMPQFMGANMPTIPTTDVAGLINENHAQKMNNYNVQMAQRQNLLGGLFGLGSAFIASDRRVKEDIKPVGTVEGEKVYSYRYKGDPTKAKHIGVMAQEVEKKHPDAVKTIGGVKHVHYGRIFGLGAPA